LKISLGEKCEPFVCRHSRVLWAAKCGHLPFDPEKNLLNWLDLWFDCLFPLLTLGDWFFRWSFAFLRHGGVFDFLFRDAKQSARQLAVF
jgi:hypothetical protein